MTADEILERHYVALEIRWEERLDRIALKALRAIRPDDEGPETAAYLAVERALRQSREWDNVPDEVIESIALDAVTRAKAQQ